MEDAERSGVPLLLNEVNAGEVFYMRAKTRSAADAEHFLDLLPTWPIQLMHNVFDDVLAPEQDVDVTPVRESAYLVERVRFHSRVPDRIEHRLYRPVLNGLSR